jgi:hypothetical protein
MNSKHSVILIAFAICSCQPNSELDKNGSKSVPALSAKAVAVLSNYVGSVEKWRGALACWHAALPSVPLGSQAQLLPEQIERLTHLPKSYREFVMAGGLTFQQTTSRDPQLATVIRRFLNPSQIGLFQKLEPVSFGIWTNPGAVFDYPLSEQYFRYDASSFDLSRSSELDKMWVVGTEEGGGFYLLNPVHKAIDGEWEAILLHPKIPGMVRFKTFAHLMAQLYVESIVPAPKASDPKASWLYYSREEWSSSCLNDILIRDW